MPYKSTKMLRNMFRLKEALSYAKERGLIKKNRELTELLWHDSSKKSAYMCMRNLLVGTTKKINIADVALICKTCGVSADYLFGLTDAPSISDAKTQIFENAKNIINLIDEI